MNPCGGYDGVVRLGVETSQVRMLAMLSSQRDAGMKATPAPVPWRATGHGSQPAGSRSQRCRRARGRWTRPRRLHRPAEGWLASQQEAAEQRRTTVSHHSRLGDYGQRSVGRSGEDVYVRLAMLEAQQAECAARIADTRRSDAACRLMGEPQRAVDGRRLGLCGVEIRLREVDGFIHSAGFGLDWATLCCCACEGSISIALAFEGCTKLHCQPARLRDRFFFSYISGLAVLSRSRYTAGSLAPRPSSASGLSVCRVLRIRRISTAVVAAVELDYAVIVFGCHNNQLPPSPDRPHQQAPPPGPPLQLSEGRHCAPLQSAVAASLMDRVSAGCTRH